jgi:uncharacterized protein YecT (DUF1311 family)
MQVRKHAAALSIPAISRKRLPSLLVALMHATAGHAHAQSSKGSGDDPLLWAKAQKCQGQAAANVCAGHDLDLKQAEMTELLRKEHDKLNGFSKAQEHLATAQDAWEKFAQSECTFQAGEAGPSSGTGFPARWGRCMQPMMQARIKQLKRDLACQHDGCWPKP